MTVLQGAANELGNLGENNWLPAAAISREEVDTPSTASPASPNDNDGWDAEQDDGTPFETPGEEVSSPDGVRSPTSSDDDSLVGIKMKGFFSDPNNGYLPMWCTVTTCEDGGTLIMPCADGCTEAAPDEGALEGGARLARLWCCMMPNGSGRVYVVPCSNKPVAEGDEVPEGCRTWESSEACIDALCPGARCLDYLLEGTAREHSAARLRGAPRPATDTQKPDSEGGRVQAPPTTLDISNLPADLNQEDLCEILDREELSGLYDFVYMPSVGAGKPRSAIVNLVSHAYAELLTLRLRTRTFWGIEGVTQSCQVTWSRPVQGLRELIRVCRDLPENTSDAEESARPQVFSGGFPAEMPGPSTGADSGKPERSGHGQ